MNFDTQGATDIKKHRQAWESYFLLNGLKGVGADVQLLCQSLLAVPHRFSFTLDQICEFIQSLSYLPPLFLRNSVYSPHDKIINFGYL